MCAARAACWSAVTAGVLVVEAGSGVAAPGTGTVWTLRGAIGLPSPVGL